MAPDGVFGRDKGRRVESWQSWLPQLQEVDPHLEQSAYFTEHLYWDTNQLFIMNEQA